MLYPLSLQPLGLGHVQIFNCRFLHKSYYSFNCRAIQAANFRDLAKSIYVGTCLGTNYINDPHIHQMTGEQFNMVTPENEMKWAYCEPQRGVHTYGSGDAIVAYAQQHNMKVRGHTLVWHQQFPDWLNSLDKASLHAAMVNRIK